jgi:hypothetical protein
MVDAAVSKTAIPKVCVGSSPTPGTSSFEKRRSSLFEPASFYVAREAEECDIMALMRSALVTVLFVFAARAMAQPAAIQVVFNPASQPGSTGPIAHLPNSMVWSYVTPISFQTRGFTNIVNRQTGQIQQQSMTAFPVTEVVDTTTSNVGRVAHLFRSTQDGKFVSYITSTNALGTPLWTFRGDVFGGNPAQRPEKAVFDGAQNLYVAGILDFPVGAETRKYNFVTKFSPTGQLLWTVIPGLTYDTGFLKTAGIAIDGVGHVRVATNRVSGTPAVHDWALRATTGETVRGSVFRINDRPTSAVWTGISVDRFVLALSTVNNSGWASVHIRQYLPGSPNFVQHFLELSGNSFQPVHAATNAAGDIVVGGRYTTPTSAQAFLFRIHREQARWARYFAFPTISHVGLDRFGETYALGHQGAELRLIKISPENAARFDYTTAGQLDPAGDFRVQSMAIYEPSGAVGFSAHTPNRSHVALANFNQAPVAFADAAIMAPGEVRLINVRANDRYSENAFMSVVSGPATVVDGQLRVTAPVAAASATVVYRLERGGVSSSQTALAITVR